jgi:hypothetical protein
MRALPCFKKLDKKSYIVWSDTGPHFRCSEFMHYLFVELAQLKIKVSFNLFCERHGKNSRDQHFSSVSNFLRQESMVKQLTSSLDICLAIERQQKIANINNSRLEALQKPNSASKEYKQVQTKAFVVPTHVEPSATCFKLTVLNLKQYYNFYTDDNRFILKTHFMSDRSDFVIIKSMSKKEVVSVMSKHIKNDHMT